VHQTLGSPWFTSAGVHLGRFARHDLEAPDFQLGGHPPPGDAKAMQAARWYRNKQGRSREEDRSSLAEKKLLANGKTYSLGA
jgi:hypothetical protein